MPDLKNLSAQNNAFVLEIKGTSMQPFLHNGDNVFVSKCVPDEISTGDIIAIALSNHAQNICVHRLLRKNLTGAHTDLFIKGDDIPRIDKIRLGSDGTLIGKIVGITRNEAPALEEKPWLNIIRLFYSLFMMPYQLIRGH
jgi:signal peptidase I